MGNHFAFTIHKLYVIYADNVLQIQIQFTFNVLNIYIYIHDMFQYPHNIKPIYIQYAYNTTPIYTTYTQNYKKHMPNTQPIYLNIQNRHTMCIQYKINLHTICTI